MKRAVAIVLSLILIGIQAMAAAQVLSTTTVASACGCCAKQEICRCCCVAPAAPDAIPLPTAPALTSASLDFTAIVPKLLAWTLPVTAPAIVSFTDTSASSLAVPLFQRDCALLI